MLKTLSMLIVLTFSTTLVAQKETSARLYLIPYSHLDTQWLWTYEKSIDPALKTTLDDNFALFEKYPEYAFNFTGAFRYKLIKQYWPERYARLKTYIAQNRWHLSGSSWDETDVVIPDPESLLRHILYANLFFEKEFGKTSVDFMLPDSFGYPASLPTVLRHAGLKGFSTQKLSWGAARGVPFNIGLWVGADGSEIFAALNPGPYESKIPATLTSDESWRGRLLKNPKLDGKAIDFRYFGIGDMGGAPREDDVKNAVAAIRDPQKDFEIKMAASDQIFRDFAGTSLKELPRVEGEMLLTEHSAGILTSNSALKVENRRSEHFAKQAEMMAATASVIDGGSYPRDTLRSGWETFLPAQMHDIMGGTAIPEANSHSMNDHFIAQNLFQSVIQTSAGRIARALDTSDSGFTLVVSNTLGFKRSDLVEIEVPASATYTHAQAPNQELIPLQVLKGGSEKTLRYLFPVTLSSTESAVYTLVRRDDVAQNLDKVKAEILGLESDLFKITLGQSGDILSIYNKAEKREELRSPIRYQFLNELPLKYPAWNMTWKDRQRPPRSYLDSKAKISIIEDGIWRSSLKVTRSAEGSDFVQIIRLTRGRPVVDIEEQIQWRSKEVSFKVSIQPSFSAPTASYDMGLSVAERPINGPKLFEMPQHQWMAMNKADGTRGISIINSCCYGADKPTAGSLRLTLLYTPHVNEKEYRYNATQDWGRHVLRWGIYPHNGDWRAARTDQLADQKNEPLLVFHPEQKTKGPLGKSFILAESDGATLRAIKQPERLDDTKGVPLILRMNERLGGKAKDYRVTLASKVLAGGLINGQENAKDEKLDFPELKFSGRDLSGKIAPFGIETLRINTEMLLPRQESNQNSIELKKLMNQKAFSSIAIKSKEAVTVGQGKISFPVEEYPSKLESRGVTFDLSQIKTEASDVMVAKGQRIDLPSLIKSEGEAQAGGTANLHILAFAGRDHKVSVRIDGQDYALSVPKFHGAIGDSDSRRLDPEFRFLSLKPAFIKTQAIAAFSSYSHGRKGNLLYYPNYLFHFILPAGKTLELPEDPDFYVAALSVSDAPIAFPLHTQPAGWYP